MRSGMIDMESNTTLVQCYPAHEAVPDGRGPFPALVVIHGASGLNAFVKGAANRLALQGFYVLAPDFYALPTSFADVAPDYMRAPTGGESQAGDTGRQAAAIRAAGLTDERADEIFAQACTYAATRSRVRSVGGVRVVGFGMGGRLAIAGACARPDEVVACVAFAPSDLSSSEGRGRDLLARLDRLQCPLVLVYGGLDMTTPLAERSALVERLGALGKRVTTRVFREAEREFYVFDSERYDISSTRDAWAEMIRLFKG